MDKQILEEVTRIKEIMGVSLIVEQASLFKKFIQNLISDYWKSQDNAIKNTMTSAIEAGGKTFDEATEILDKIKNGTSISDYPEIDWHKIIDNVISSTSDKAYKNMFYDAISTEIDDQLGKAIKNINDTVETTDFDELKNLDPKLHDELVDKLTDIKTKIADTFKDDPDMAAIINSKLKLDDIPAKVIDQSTSSAKKFTKAAGKSIKDAVYEWAEIDLPAIGVWYSEMARWYDTWSRDLKNALSALRDQISKLFGKELPEEGWGTKSILGKIEQLSNEITELMTKNIEEGTPEVNERMLARLTELIYSLKESSNTNPKSILDQLKTKNLISNEVYDELMKDNSKFTEWWNTVKEAYESKGGKILTSIGTGFADEARAMWEMNPLLFIFRGISKGVEAKSLVEGLKGAWETATQTGKRWIWYVVWNDPRFPKEVLSLRNARGTTAITMAGGILVSHLVFTEFILPAIYSLVYTTYVASDDVMGGERVYGPDEIEKFDWTAEILKTYKEHGGVFAADTESTMEDFITQRLLFFTNIDNLMAKWVHLLKQDNVTEQDVEEYKEEAKETLEEIKTEGEKIEQKLDTVLTDIKNETDTLIQQGKPVQDTIVSKAEELWNQTKETATKLMGDADLTLEDAKRLGICEFAYNSKAAFGTWKYVDDNQVKFIKETENQIITYKLGKTADGTWAWNTADPGQTPVYSTPLKCQ